MKVRGTTITTPIPKSVYRLYYHEGNGWGNAELNYGEALNAFNSGKVVIFRHQPIAGCGHEDYYCVKHETLDEMLTYSALVFLGSSGGLLRYVRVYDNGDVRFGVLADINDLYLKQEVLESRLDSMPFKELIGTSSKPVVLRDLESGVYLITGTIKANSPSGKSTCNGDIFIVCRDDVYGYTYAYKFVPSIISIGRYAITNSTVSYTSYKLSDITSLLSRVTDIENRLAALGV